MGTSRPLSPVNELQEMQNQEHIIPIITSSASSSAASSSKLPCGDLLKDDRREEYISICIPLYEASIKGDWKAAEDILKNHPDMVRNSITENHETALHIASSTKKVQFVKNLVNVHMQRVDLELQNKNGNTALSLAAAAGTTEIAKILVEKNETLLTIANESGMMPLYVAALFGYREMVEYLYGKSHKLDVEYGWTFQNRGWLLLKCVETNLFDVTLKILEDCPKILDEMQGHTISDILGVLARKREDDFIEIKPHVTWRIINWFLAFIQLKVGPAEKESRAMQLLKIVWKKVVKKPKSQIDDIIRGRKFDATSKHNSKESPIIELARFVCKDVVVKHKYEIDEIIRGHDPVKKQGSIGSDYEESLFQLLKIVWKEIAYNPNSEILKIERNISDGKKTYSSRVLFVATEMGNTKFVVELIREYPDLIWKQNDEGLSIFHVAVLHRRESIYNLLYELGSMKDLITTLKDENGNNMLHLVGKIATTKRLQDVSGVALQMQRELLWFKEVEAMIPPLYRERKNKDGLTPHELFTKEHKGLVSQGEKWMKGTAGQCMVVATLIATIVFAAAFTVPGGYNQNTGIPMFFQDRSFIVFVIADAISLFSSSTSIIMFLAILTSRFAEFDFLRKLPEKLMIGLITLFISIATMMIAFGISFFVLYHKGLKWVPILICSFAVVPVILFALLQFPLLMDVYRSTYGSRYLFKPKKRMLY